MVRHLTVGVAEPVEPLDGLRQDLEEELTIRIDEEDLGARIAATGDMVESPRVLNAKRASHGSSLQRPMRDCKTQPRRPSSELVARGAALVGIDTPSADPLDPVLGCPSHRILLGAGIPIVEGLCNLGAVPNTPGSLWFGCFPLKFEGVDGSPVRAVAFTGSP